jgi:hypothetical protein
MTLIPPSATMLATSLHATLDDAFVYRGMCDASAAAALGPDLFVAANDERNLLKVYRRGQPVHVDKLDLSDHLGTDADQESDLEGAATIGERIYWISSHGRNKKGKFQERRHRFFATEWQDGRLVAVGMSYSSLLADMIAAPQLRQFGLAEASRKMPEESGAFNIEGLAATPQGGLLIGLRNPAPLVILLRNPAQVIEGGPAVFGEALRLDLGGLGIRSIELVGAAYMIVAGPQADQGEFALYQWSGDARQKPVRLAHQEFGEVRPEALFAIPGTRKVQILSDDGGAHVKKMTPNEQTFFSVTVTL